MSGDGTPDSAWRLALGRRIGAEVLDLVDAHAPAVDTAPYRQRLRRRRGVWSAPPPGLVPGG
jgi:hypothetical protein